MVSTLVVGAKSLSENQFVAGDDFGKLKLYRGQEMPQRSR